MSGLLRAWLLAWLLAVGLSLACLVLLMLDHLIRGRWGDAIRPTLESGARSLLGWSLGFIPIALGVEWLYPWTEPGWAAGDPILLHKAGYLTSAGFSVRGVAILIAWCGLALWLTHGGERRRKVAACGLIVVFLSMTVAAVDWVSSLDPRYYSSAFGLAIFTSQIVAGLAMVLLIVVIRTQLHAEVAHDLGNLLLLTLLLWAYIAFTQYLLVWSADLPTQSAWYLARGVGGWLVIISAIALLRLGGCLVALLLRPVKRSPRWLALVCLTLLVTYVLELYWYVVPSPSSPGFSWLDVVLPLVVVMVWPFAPLRASSGGAEHA